MAEYVAPLKDMKFVLEHVVGLDQVNQLPAWQDLTADLVEAILEEAAKFAGEVLSPLNASGDRAGCLKALDEARHAPAEGRLGRDSK